MKLTKKIEAEVLKVYRGYWDAYLKGDMKTFASMLADDITVFGTAVSEVFNNKKEALRFYKATADQLVGKVQFRNRQIGLQAVENNILINEQNDCYALMNKKWIYYGHARVSAVLKQTRSGWKVIHQHASFPDTRTDEGEQLAAEKIKKENLQLRDAVKRRTIELEDKNRELEIEAALEKVRAQALGMRKPGELLNVCKVVYNELLSLGFTHLRNAIIHSFNDEQSRFIDYDYSGLTGGAITDIHYDAHPVIKKFIKQIRRSDNAFFQITVRKNDLKDWKKFRKKGGQPDDPRLNRASAIHYYCYSINNASIGISTFNTINEEQLQILKRFRNVFDFAYRRYMDVAQAEAQAREARVEAALERVRAKSMAMHHSEDLIGVINVVKEQLIQLGFRFNAANFVTDYSDKGYTMWLASPEESYPFKIYVPGTKQKLFKAVTDAAEKGLDFVPYTLSFKEKNIWFRNFFENTPASITSEKNKQLALSAKGMAASQVLLKNIRFSVMNLDLIPYTEEQNNIIKRLGYVFEQSYVRFLDLQKAEDQAREAQIEAALERVRARTMGMHQSQDLHDVIETVTNQLLGLGLRFDNASFCKVNDDNSWELWISTPQQAYPSLIHVPYLDHKIFNQLNKQKARGSEVFADVYDEKETRKFFKHFFEKTIAINASEERKQHVLNRKGFARSVFWVKDIWFSIGVYDPIPFTDEENLLIRRFAKVFEQSYTRFLDLQKAEAQAREAQIEAGLERVRSRAMGMQSSDELNALIGTVFTELTKLDLALTRCVIWVFDPAVNAPRWWMANGEEPSNPMSFFIKYHEHPAYLTFLNEWKNQNVRFVYDLKGQDKKSWDEILFNQTELKNLPDVVKNGMQAPERVLLSASFNNFGGINVASLEPLSDEHFDILLRFAKVFDLTYTRFNDLKQAELQARESQVQLALERVRARTMAMQKSDELSETSFVLFQQFRDLGSTANQMSIGIIHESDNMMEMSATIDGSQLNNVIDVSLDEPIVMKRLAFAWKEQKKSLVIDLSGEELNEYNEYRSSLSNIKFGTKEGDHWVIHIAFFSKGILSFSSHYRHPDETVHLLERFAAVFDLTYTRFLDLKQAEAQAREAKIEAALERVRARSLGMQKSDELAEVVAVLYKQFEELDFGLYQVLVSIYDRKNKIIEWWSRGFGDIDLPQRNIIPIIDHPFNNDLLEKWENGVEYYPHILEGELKKSWDEYLFTQTDLKNFPGEIKDTMRSFDKVYLSDVFMKYGSLQAAGPAPLPDDKADILKRFVKVLDLAYTRMIDLQNAEAQARESHVQLALERVRARTMAMQKSDELPETSLLLFQQMKELGETVVQNSIAVIKEDEGFVELSTTVHGHLEPKTLHVPIEDPHVMAKAVAAWKAKRKSLIVEIEGQELKEYNELRNSFLETKVNFPEDNWIVNIVFFSKGWLSFSSNHNIAKESFQLLERFAGVFDLTYTRFLDLKQAEEQARESQIQLALERVRARTMAMQKSDELSETSYVLFEQFSELGEAGDQVSIGIYDEDEKVMKLYSTFHGSRWDEPARIEYSKHPVYNRMFSAWKGQKRSAVTDLSGTELHEFNKFKLTIPGYRVSEDEMAKDRWVVYTAFFSNGLLSYASPGPKPKESIDLLERFASVFDLTYTRFLDLEKAEAQAREAQIEAGLERVRSRSLAMHNTSELQEVIHTVHKELLNLNIAIHGGSFITINSDIDRELLCWGSGGTADTSEKVHLPFYEKPFCTNLINRIKSGPGFFSEEYTQEEKKDFFTFLFNYEPWSKLDQEQKNETLLSAGGYTRSCCVSQYTSIFIINHYGKKFSTADNDILKRFGKVFEQSYTRFLDLQKAEAQAREAQIETALERVRAVAMAMRKPEELMQISEVIYKQLGALGFSNVRNVQIAIDDDKRKTYSGVEYSEYYENRFTEVHYDSSPMFREIADEMKRSSSAFFQKIIGGKEFEDWKEWRATVKDENDKGVHPDVATATTMCFYLHSVGTGMLGISTFDPISNEQIDILKRFKNVFELSYRRYIDIEKAEAQAREAQIELALERVRARTMAMHRSEELAETAQVLFHQLNELGGAPDRISIGIADEKEGVVKFWSTDQLGSHISKSFKARLNERTVISKTYQAWKEHKRSIVIDLQGDDLNEWIKFARGEMGIVVKDENIHDRRVHNLAFFSHGWILVTTHEPQSAETIQILERFASVFNLTYRRFLDLEKAEAQAKEAQIEAALEKVRSRSLAMHKSSELQEVVDTVFERLKELNIQMDSANIAIFQEGKRDFDFWIASPGRNYTESFDIKEEWDFVITRDLIKAKESGQDFFGKCFSYEEKNAWFDFAFANTDFKYIARERQEYILGAKAYALSIAFSKHTGIQINNYSGQLLSENETGILKRFSKVFEQAYIRFLDLEKAEVQARESQIQLALERVRARTMAMQRSNELTDAAMVMFQQLKELGVNAFACGFVILDKNDTEGEFWMSSEGVFQPPHFIPHMEEPSVKNMYLHWKSKEEFYAEDVGGEALKSHYKYLMALPKSGSNFKGLLDAGINFPEWQRMYAAYFSHGYLLIITKEQYKEENIFIRFAKVFEQTYTRFLDLEKAEAQAREAHIEASLERVRSKTMAMHNSNDVGDTVATMFAEFVNLDIETIRCGIAIIHSIDQMEVWTAKPDENGKVSLTIGSLPMTIHPMLITVFENWKNKEPQTSYELIGEDLKNYFREINNSPDYPIRYDIGTLPQRQMNTAFYFPEGCLFAFSNETIPAQSSAILKRFAGLFGQTYRRYLDLQKAEANAREAQIEAGLERVRARTMAMHSSDDVSVATATMFTELEKLGIQNLRGGITIINPDCTQEVWGVTNLPDGKTIRSIGVFDMRLHPLWLDLFNAKENNDSYRYYWMAGQDKENYIAILNATPNYLAQPIKNFPDVHVQSYFFGGGAIWTNSLEPHSEEQKQIMKRFASVFSLTFRRFQDLQKAEAQAREAKIEASLERVRSKAMAMHNSQDLSDTVGVFYKELQSFSITPRRCGVGLLKEDRTGELFTWNTTEQGESLELVGKIRLEGHPVLEGVYDHWVTQTEFHPVLRGNEIKEYYKVIRPQIAFPDYTNDQVQYGYFFFFKEGGVYAFTENEMKEDELQIYRRFSSVLSLTYKRYKDLQQAEANAREAQIEAALEKVRGKAMAMHNSNDLSVTASMIISELKKLGISPIRCGVGILSRETHRAQLYTATVSPDGDGLSVVGWVQLNGHPVLENIYDKWIAGEDYFPELSGDSRRSYYEQLLAGLSVPLPDFKNEQKHYGHFFAISVGCLYAWSDVKYNDDEIKILKRFATIIDLTFRRYFELQKSEENAKEAVKQAALDRIRAEIASMRTITDLDRITPLIWNELTILGIPFIRCGVFLMDDSPQLIHTFLSTPDGKAIGAFHLPYDTPGNLRLVVSNWQRRSIYIDHWNENEFQQFAQILVQQGALDSAEAYLKTIPRGGFHLHFLPFLQGMLYVGNTERLNASQIELIQHVADAFSTAYARYEDFNKLEAAKKQVENTLTDLKQAQQQLVQSEKMASLGELTAGIAHEIQNPLNFVNNFSDVSNELLEEMKGELTTGNMQSAMDIAEDVKQNLEKILHHGKRADAIVKGMLQHSRTSSGQKEMTDINILADEYLRLAYHGLRAKDKSFNAKFETYFDNSIEKINVIPQEIGRVILNLINNAFYTVTEKKKRNENGYEPTVTITTQKDNGKIEIKVSDNGNGIPQKILDKIFQPFFTTKPTGQGTGLGLSLAYDIITKGHSGELKVETKEGEGSEFIIQLPAN